MTRAPDVRFELDARIELLSVVARMARPEKKGRGKPRLDYAVAAEGRLSGLSGHPAVTGLDRLLRRGVPEPLFAEMILEQPDPRRLEADPRASRGALTQAGGEAEIHRFFSDLRELSARSGFADFLVEQRPAHARFLALARREAASAQSPEDVAAYLRAPFNRTYRLILAPLLPRGFYVNVSRPGVEARVRSGTQGRKGLTFEYDVFVSTVAHELTHTVVSPLIESSRAVFGSYRRPPPKDCNDPHTWSGCIEEHLVRALTLRALAAKAGEKAYRKILRANIAQGYPFLEEMCEHLREHEKAPGEFADFYPGFIADFTARNGLAP